MPVAKANGGRQLFAKAIHQIRAAAKREQESPLYLVDVGTHVPEDKVDEYCSFLRQQLRCQSVKIVCRQEDPSGRPILHLECVGDRERLAAKRLAMRMNGWELLWLCDLDHQGQA